MTRLFYGSTALAGLCAMTLIVGCGGSSSPKVPTCDGGACVDAKRDTGPRLDTPPANLDVARLDTPAPPTDGPAPNLDGPPPKLDGPPPTVDGPAPTVDGPAPTIDGPAPNLDGPPPKLDGPPPTTDGPAPNLDGPPPKLDGPPDAAPKDTIPPNPTDAADAAADSLVIPPDAGPDTIATTDAVGDGGPDAPVGDAGPDLPAPTIDAAGDAGADLAPVVLDAAADSVADAPQFDAPAVLDGGAEVGDGGGCEGETCHAYTFQGDNPDASLASTGFTAVNAGTWGLVVDGTNVVLEGTNGGAPTSFAEANLPPASSTDETIEVKVRFMNADPGNVVRICGRFDSTGTPPATDAYCLEISIVPGDAGATPGSMTIVERNGDGLSTSTNATAANLPITVGSWHTYRFSIAFSPGPAVVLQGFLDGATTPTVDAADAPPNYTHGTVALGVRNVTADFDNLIVTTP